MLDAHLSLALSPEGGEGGEGGRWISGLTVKRGPLAWGAEASPGGWNCTMEEGVRCQWLIGKGAEKTAPKNGAEMVQKRCRSWLIGFGLWTGAAKGTGLLGRGRAAWPGSARSCWSAVGHCSRGRGRGCRKRGRIRGRFCRGRRARLRTCIEGPDAHRCGAT